MSTKSNQIIQDYLTEDPVVATLNRKQTNTLFRIFSSFSNVISDDVKVKELIAYCKQIIINEKAFDMEIAKVSNKALDIMLNKKA